MFGFSFGEILVLVIVGIVVVGPRKLPQMMRTLGQWVSKIRRMSTDLRAQSGIDDLIRQEGLERELRELRSLSRVNVIETLVNPVSGAATAGAVASAAPRLPTPAAPPIHDATTYEDDDDEDDGIKPIREREYPALGCDAYGAFPDDAEPYTGAFGEASPPAPAAPPLQADAGTAATTDENAAAAPTPSTTAAPDRATT
ncbi:Sec-independent protein translocase protein TatB [Chondromyces crocatus]|uniref:Sec-independent protein translocase protein TatB homolog n=1 Tax=Chondromyces crocatus TaxID=52 RepID=A0A0K1EJQ5_CHOCO|nr:Sec-independent protein translocase protein TatB [Chondromyces crocatus]AKT40922.1 uncharacterized protein CMC5_050790 [Chondromyces crocatus]